MVRIQRAPFVSVVLLDFNLLAKAVSFSQDSSSVLEAQAFSQLVPLSPVLWKRILAVGVVVTWAVGCLIGNGQPGPFEVVLRPIW